MPSSYMGLIQATVHRIMGSLDATTFLAAAQSARQVLAARIFLRRCTIVGRLARLVGRPRIYNNGTMVIGERVLIHSTTVPIELTTVNGGILEIGDRTFINYGVSISAFQLVRIGRRCLIGTYVNILDNNWHDVVDRTIIPPSQPVILEDNVWLGNRVIVLPGVTIGHDAVIGAGAVVTKDIPPRSVAVGNPARVVRTF